MRSWNRAVRLVAGLIVLVVAGSTIALAVRQGSWSPILSMSWFPAVVAAWAAASAGRPGTAGRCWPRRPGRAA
jgi:hypothetical protein